MTTGADSGAGIAAIDNPFPEDSIFVVAYVDNDSYRLTRSYVMGSKIRFLVWDVVNNFWATNKTVPIRYQIIKKSSL